MTEKHLVERSFSFVQTARKAPEVLSKILLRFYLGMLALRVGPYQTNKGHRADEISGRTLILRVFGHRDF
jgi:hypothetical protein